MGKNTSNLEEMKRQFPFEEKTIDFLVEEYKLSKYIINELNLTELYEKVTPSNYTAFIMLMEFFTERGFCKEFYQIQSHFTGYIIKEFDSLEEIPDVVYDWSAKKPMYLKPEDIKIVVRFGGG